MLRILFSGIALSLAAFSASQADQRYFRWVDENGVVHYGDRVPAEYAKIDRQVVNEQGVEVETLPGEKTDDELAADRIAAIEAERAEQRQIAARERDSILLNTYLSVGEIEALRDRRIELIDSQIRVTELYLSSLRDKRAKLEKEARRYRPYSDKPQARPIPDNLARELSDTLDSIILYEKNLDQARVQQTQLVAKFDADIDRFRALKGLN